MRLLRASPLTPIGWLALAAALGSAALAVVALRVWPAADPQVVEHVHPDLPFMHGDAPIEPGKFDAVLDDVDQIGHG